jgi:hypothetical protein
MVVSTGSHGVYVPQYLLVHLRVILSIDSVLRIVSIDVHLKTC